MSLDPVYGEASLQTPSLAACVLLRNGPPTQSGSWLMSYSWSSAHADHVRCQICEAICTSAVLKTIARSDLSQHLGFADVYAFAMLTYNLVNPSTER